MWPIPRSPDHPDSCQSERIRRRRSIFITGINAPDGIAIDKHDNLWSAPIRKTTSSCSTDRQGDREAWRFQWHQRARRGARPPVPASLAFSLDRKTLYVSNLTLFLPSRGTGCGRFAWTLEVKRYTVAKLRAAIPRLMTTSINTRDNAGPR